ncbi:hypothetical protein [Commensalibacter papalotli (ex Botero et al. 2024)]|uniref:Uncharacterized protein n=1 Tax=Commensalibacter papalotli (ex Botero et al. 2024) TaxID=2972766 RepID=A0ABM9HRC5_9PROT|nr:hypothetical protein [Commensalibacter papalotli (ex Botero et al. 2024)]CAI3943488.1 unnamed protein product [Commensalibacter papalotli (ex Botero et al. 2024)]CAI3947407.1 unnamed protein product [Commensalibacter papalotli (ex Botero et al. 2024)]
MKFITDNTFSLKPILKWNGSFSEKSRVLINGHLTRYKVYGEILYKCIQVYSYYLLFITYEEDMIYVSNVYLFNNKEKKIDKAKIYASYLQDDLNALFGLIDEDTYSGELTDFKFVSSNEMTFKFFKSIWKLEILEKPRCYLYSDMVDRSCGRLLERPPGLRTYLKFNIVHN